MFATNLSQHLNARSISAMRLLAFFKQIPEFSQLNVDDKMILTKYNLMSLIIFNCALSYNVNTQLIIEANSDVPLNSSILRTVHGEEMYMQVKSLFKAYVHIAKYDEKIILLSFIVFILTKGISTGDGAPEPILNDNMAVYRAQESYTELLCKYLEIVYGSEQAFRIITTLVTRFLTWQLVERKLRHNVKQNFLATGENDLLPLMQSLYHVS